MCVHDPSAVRLSEREGETEEIKRRVARGRSHLLLNKEGTGKKEKTGKDQENEREGERKRQKEKE